MSRLDDVIGNLLDEKELKRRPRRGVPDEEGYHILSLLLDQMAHQGDYIFKQFYHAGASDTKAREEVIHQFGRLLRGDLIKSRGRDFNPFSLHTHARQPKSFLKGGADATAYIKRWLKRWSKAVQDRLGVRKARLWSGWIEKELASIL